MQNVKLKSYLQLHLIVFIWGFTAVLGKLITLDALPLVWIRMLLAVIIVFFYLKIKKTTFQISRKDLLILFFLGLVIALHWFTFFKAIKESNVSVTLACISTGALFASVLEPIFFKRKLILYELLFGGLVVLGLIIIFKLDSKYHYGILLSLISAFLSAFFAVINGIYVNKYDAGVITFYELLGGVIFFTIILLLNQQIDALFFDISINDWMYLFILSSICTAYAFITNVKIMKYISPFSVMLTVNLEPIYGIILALLLFKESETMDHNFYIGTVIILSTIVLNGLIKYFKKDTKN
ncbi:MAG: DMT family transporter [Flavobacterium sp.]